jgi:amino acid transporter
MGAMALFMALTGTFVKLAIASSVLRLLGYIVCVASLPAVRRNADDDARARAFRLKGGYAIPVIAMVICFWLLAQSEQHSWITVVALLAVGWLFFALERWYQARD